MTATWSAPCCSSGWRKEAGADAAKFQNFRAPQIVFTTTDFSAIGWAGLSHQASWKKSVFQVYQDASIPFEWIRQS